MGAIASVGSQSARGEISIRAGICGCPSGVVIKSRARRVSRSARVKWTSKSSAPSMVSRSNSPVSASGAAKSRSVENRPALPVRYANYVTVDFRTFVT